MIVPNALFEHVARLTDDIGIFEHAEGSRPRREHGYCVDDVARALVVVSREPDPEPAVVDLARIYLAFLARAQVPDGRSHNRLGIDNAWHDEPSVDDCWGRALWAFGTAAARSPRGDLSTSAAAHFALGAQLRSPHAHAMAFAALGAAEILSRWPTDRIALDLIAAVPAVIGRPRADTQWPWPEPRLAYANAALAEALIIAGEYLGDQRHLDNGLTLLAWLLETETVDGHLSVTPVGGWARDEPRPGFDQQPIEVAALADACARASRLTGDAVWDKGIDRAIRWFLGDNDSHCSLYEPSTGGGCDGLQRVGRNENQGAESTLAMVATLQHARRPVRRP